MTHIRLLSKQDCAQRLIKAQAAQGTAFGVVQLAAMALLS
jgi:hypothetical protein